MNNWQDAEQHADRALDFFERGRWSDAETELRKALDIDPDQGDWHDQTGCLHRCHVAGSRLFCRSDILVVVALT